MNALIVSSGSVKDLLLYLTRQGQSRTTFSIIVSVRYHPPSIGDKIHTWIFAIKMVSWWNLVKGGSTHNPCSPKGLYPKVRDTSTLP